MKKFINIGILCALLFPMVSLAYFDTSLKYGSRGEAVSELQDFLQDQDFLIGKVDGKYGLGTVKAVKAFQTANGLFADGYFGKGSRAKASSLLAVILKDSDATELAETGAVIPVVKSILFDACKNIDGVQSEAPQGMWADNGICLSVMQNPTSTSQSIPITPIEVSFNDFGNRDFIFVSRFETSNALTLFINNIFDGDTVTITFNGSVITKTFNGKNVPSVPDLYGSYQFPETVGLTPNTEYPYILKVQRGNKYAIRTGIFKTLTE